MDPFSPTSPTVRFDDTCVLIPEGTPVKSRPRIITKSYSLPLWKTGPASPPVHLRKGSEDEMSQSPSEEMVMERKAFSLTLSVPSLAIGRPRRPSLPPASPCLSRRYLQGSDISSSPPSTSPPHPTPPTRTLPQITHVPASHTSPTIPLRPCCQACYHSVDSAIALGEEWKEHWSPGALRRHHEKQTCLFGITRVWKPKGPDVGLEKALIGGLKVDEVDGRCLKKRVASEESEGGEDVNEEMMTSLTLDEPVPEEPEEEEQPLFPSSHYLPQTSPIPISIPEPKPPSYILDPTLPDPDMLLPPPPPTSTPSYPRQRSASTSPTRHRDRSASHSSVGSGAGTPMQNRRRPSVSESFIRGSTSIFKNVTAGITGAGMLR